MAAANSRIGSSGAKTGGQLQLSLDIEQGNNEDKEVDSLIKPGKAVSESAAKVVQPLKLGPIPACALYSFCSVSMVLTNKSLASSYETNFNILLVVFQAAIAVGLCQLCKSFALIDYPSFNSSTAKQWAPVNVFFCLMLFTGMASLQHNSVPMVTVFKNISNIFTAFGDYLFFGSSVDNLTKLSFGVMLAGAMAASVGDSYITFLGFFWMVANCLSTSAYILYMKHATRTVKLSKFGMVYYNNVLATLLLLPVTILNGDLATFLQRSDLYTFDYAMKNSWAGFVGFFLNFASLTCISVTGPTTYAIVGSMNKIPTAFIGFLAFDTPIDPQTWAFMSVSLVGGFIYSYAKIRGKK